MFYISCISGNIIDKYPSKEDINHFNNCDECSHCDWIMEFYGKCHYCGIIIIKKELYYDVPAGDYYCEDCVKNMPINNTDEFVLCSSCLKRDLRENMIEYHYNFDTEWTCDKCVEKSTINSRFEILDL